MKMTKQKTLQNIYYNVEEPEGYAGAQPIIKKVNSKISKDDVKKWLQSQDAYTLFKPIRKKFPRNKF